MSINTIGGAIITLLTPLLTDNKIAQLDQYSSREVLGYPRIQVLSRGMNTDYLTNVERLKTYNFGIVITQEKTVENMTPSVAETVSDTLVQEVMDLFDGQINTATPLGGAVSFIRPVNVEETESTEELPTITHIIQLEAVKIV